MQTLRPLQWRWFEALSNASSRSPKSSPGPPTDLSGVTNVGKVHGYRSQSAKQAKDHRVQHRRPRLALDLFYERRSPKIGAEDQDGVGPRRPNLSRHIQNLLVCRLGEAEIVGEVEAALGNNVDRFLGERLNDSLLHAFRIWRHQTDPSDTSRMQCVHHAQW
jgi:hypothetical protein